MALKTFDPSKSVDVLIAEAEVEIRATGKKLFARLVTTPPDTWRFDLTESMIILTALAAEVSEDVEVKPTELNVIS